MLAVPASDNDRADFVRKVISDYQSGNLYQTAKIADEYDRCRNTTAMQYQKFITDVYGRKYIDRNAVVHRSTSNFFNVIITQLNQYLLGNGVSWKNDTDMGEDFDTRLQQAGKAALSAGVSYGFWNLDHLEVFTALEFAPLYDEENGSLAAGVRFWQIDSNKPLRATLYELDGVTNYLWLKDDKTRVNDKWIALDNRAFMMPKVPYTQIVRESAADGTEILDGENYPGFPIVPLWGNPHKQSELVGLREKIDAYDFVLNGWEDDLDRAQVFWIISGAGGMDDSDLLQFLDRLRNVGAAAPGDGQEVKASTIEIPVQARETLLIRLEKQIYRDAMLMNPEDLASSAATATQIRAAYERQNVKADQFEYCILDFLRGIMAIAGIEDEPTFTRSAIVNTQEEIQSVVMAANYLGSEYVTRKVLTLLGDGDQADAVLKAVDAEDAERLAYTGDMNEETA